MAVQQGIWRVVIHCNLLLVLWPRFPSASKSNKLSSDLPFCHPWDATCQGQGMGWDLEQIWHDRYLCSQGTCGLWVSVRIMTKQCACLDPKPYHRKYILDGFRAWFEVTLSICRDPTTTYKLLLVVHLDGHLQLEERDTNILSHFGVNLSFLHCPLS